MRTGTDVVEHERFLNSITRNGGKLKERLFSHEELRDNPLPLDLAMIFSAKESIAKALGTGFDGNLSWQDIRITISEGNIGAELFGRAFELAGNGEILVTASRGEHRTLTCALLSERG